MKNKFLSDFKAFATRGNAIDMAIGIIIGAAFGKIVSSLVDNIIMPLIGVAVGDVNFTDLKWVVSPEHIDAEGKNIAEVAVGYGLFLQNTLDFILIAFSIFCFITLMGRFVKKQEKAPAPPSASDKLLTEIRDILNKKINN